MFKNPSFLFDIVCTVVWLLLAVRYARKGFLASSVQLGGNVFSLVGARVFSGWAAVEVFQRFLAGSFRTQIAESISAGGVVDLTGINDAMVADEEQQLRLAQPRTQRVLQQADAHGQRQQLAQVSRRADPAPQLELQGLFQSGVGSRRNQGRGVRAHGPGLCACTSGRPVRSGAFQCISARSICTPHAGRGGLHSGLVQRRNKR